VSGNASIHPPIEPPGELGKGIGRFWGVGEGGGGWGHRRPKRRLRRREAGRAAWMQPGFPVRLWEWRLRKYRWQRRQSLVFLRCAPDIDKGFPSGNACAVRAARNSVRGRWNGRNRRQTCLRREKGS